MFAYFGLCIIPSTAAARQKRLPHFLIQRENPPIQPIFPQTLPFFPHDARFKYNTP